MSDPLSAGEMDCLAVLWAAHAQGEEALKLSEIHDLVGKRRLTLGEAPPAPTTVSTYLRTLLAKRLVQDVLKPEPGEARPQEPPAPPSRTRGVPETKLLPERPAPPIRTRGVRGILPPTRSPRTAYQAVEGPGQVLFQTFKTLAEAYPLGQRRQALLDFAAALELPPDQRSAALLELARALNVPEKIVKKLAKVLEE